MSHTASARGSHDAAGLIDNGWDGAPPGRDWKKVALVAGLGILSWVATYVGMLELIEANMGELPMVHKIIIGFSVGMLMLMIIWLLDQMFARHNFLIKSLYIVGYLFLTLISVGFGFGFYWKVLESRSEASRSAESAVGQVQGSLHAASTRLEQLVATLGSLTAISEQKAAEERDRGSSCPGSKPGFGPRRQLREDDAKRFQFAAEFVKGRVGAVKADIGVFDADLARIAANDAALLDKSGTRNEFMRSLSRKLDVAVTRFNAFRTDPQLRVLRNDLAERADKVTFPDTKGGTYQCPDPQLSAALKGVVAAIDKLPDLEKPKVAVVEGSEAVIEAFRRLITTLAGAFQFKLPPSPEELRALQTKAVQSVAGAEKQREAMMEQAGLGKRDYVPLSIAIFVDFCLLLVSIGRPMSRFVSAKERMREAQEGPAFQILSRFHDIHNDEKVRQNFEVFRHVIFDWMGDYHAAIPLSAPRTAPPEEKKALQLEAQTLANLFSGLEPEGLFARRPVPVRIVQRRLRKQESKFAETEAFRVYRFKSRAWPEMILGTIMGAAKRVEATKRHAERAAAAADQRAGSPAPAAAPLPSAAGGIATAANDATGTARTTSAAVARVAGAGGGPVHNTAETNPLRRAALAKARLRSQSRSRPAGPSPFGGSDGDAGNIMPFPGVTAGTDEASPSSPAFSGRMPSPDGLIPSPGAHHGAASHMAQAAHGTHGEPGGASGALSAAQVLQRAPQFRPEALGAALAAAVTRPQIAPMTPQPPLSQPPATEAKVIPLPVSRPQADTMPERPVESVPARQPEAMAEPVEPPAIIMAEERVRRVEVSLPAGTAPGATEVSAALVDALSRLARSRVPIAQAKPDTPVMAVSAPPLAPPEHFGPQLEPQIESTALPTQLEGEASAADIDVESISRRFAPAVDLPVKPR